MDILSNDELLIQISLLKQLKLFKISKKRKLKDEDAKEQEKIRKLLNRFRKDKWVRCDSNCIIIYDDKPADITYAHKVEFTHSTIAGNMGYGRGINVIFDCDNDNLSILNFLKNTWRSVIAVLLIKELSQKHRRIYAWPIRVMNEQIKNNLKLNAKTCQLNILYQRLASILTEKKIIIIGQFDNEVLIDEFVDNVMKQPHYLVIYKENEKVIVEFRGENKLENELIEWEKNEFSKMNIADQIKIINENDNEFSNCDVCNYPTSKHCKWCGWHDRKIVAHLISYNNNKNNNHNNNSNNNPKKKRKVI